MSIIKIEILMKIVTAGPSHHSSLSYVQVICEGEQANTCIIGDVTQSDERGQRTQDVRQDCCKRAPAVFHIALESVAAAPLMV